MRRLGLGLVVMVGCGAPERPEAVGSSAAAVTTVCGAGDTSGVQGVDVSVYQGAFDWNAQVAAGVVWGYARIGDGLGADSEFANNWTQMQAAGVLRGAYQFFEPADDEVAQADLMIQAVGQLQAGDLPCMIDVEVTGGQLGSVIASKVQHWMQLVQAGTGKPPIIYTGPYFWEDNVGAASLGSTPLWVADYGPSCPLVPSGWSNWTMWQYSDGGGSLDHDVFNGTLADLQKLAAAPATFPIVAHRTAADIDGDGRSDVCGRSASGVVCQHASAAAFPGPGWTDAAGWNRPESYWTIQLADVNGDGLADICGRDSNGVVCELSTGTSFTGAEWRGPGWSDATQWNGPEYYTTIQFGDLNGDHLADVCARGAAGIVCALATPAGFTKSLIQGPAWSDAAGWAQPQYYATVTLADVNGDGMADVCGRSPTGVECALSNGTGFDANVIPGPAWSDAAGWASAPYASTLRFGDIDGDGKADVCGRGPMGIECGVSDGSSLLTLVHGPAWDDASGWDAPARYTSIELADVNGDGSMDLCARDAEGVVCALSSAGGGFVSEIRGPGWSTAGGWDGAAYGSTVGFADIDGDGKDDVCGRGAAGLECALSTGLGFGPLQVSAPWSDASGWAEEPYYATLRYTGVKSPARPPPATTNDGGVPIGDLAVDHECSVGWSRDPARGSWWLGLAALAFLRRRARGGP